MDITDIFNLQFDLSFLDTLGRVSLGKLIYFLITHGVWVLLAWFFLWASWLMWVSYRQLLYHKTRKFVVLAIDVPQENFQTPKAVENLFAHLHGIIKSGSLVDRYWHGKFPESISLELISIDGYTQFVMRANRALRDVIEASVYAQYPDAEISEVADYVKEVPQTYPDEEYKMFGTEIILSKEDAYPLRTYPDFEDRISGEYKDPIASLMESLSALQRGEQIWLQLIIYPVFDTDWKGKGDDLVKKLSGIPTPEKPKSLLLKIIEMPFEVIRYTIEQLILGGEEARSPQENKTDASNLMHIPPGQKKVIENIEKKISKLGFKTSFRIIYIGHHTVFNKARGVMPIFGGLRQFCTQDMNSLRPDMRTITDADYFFTKRRIKARQNKLFGNYRSRSLSAGASPFILNTEELATIYHFPTVTTKAPLMKKTSGKRSEAPVNLPRRR